MPTNTDDLEIFSSYNTESFVGTQLRRIYYNMRYKENGTKAKTFLVTSSARGEGKSTIAALLAITIAATPKIKVLIVDSDLRRPRLHKLLDLEPGPGMKECLEGTADPMEVAKRTRLDNLHAITAGHRTDEPARLFESDTLSAFFEKVKFYYDVVVVDSAPVLAVSDTLFMCPDMESVLFVLLAGVTPREVAQRAMETLVESHANIAGIVVNNALGVLPYYYDQQYYDRTE